MTTSSNNLKALDVFFTENTVNICLDDGQTLSLDLDEPWLDWLAKASPEDRLQWTIEPNGIGIYWENLDDGIEVCHAIEFSTSSLEIGH
jgi:hypothetical protein